ncbi:MAG: response regulator [Bacteriovoracaceae bacterium]|jgi:signal transduction histidine kinase/CheY-like chemotaxis protein|nr:response regulator [Bacteriovoracaceae bacterium]
MAIKNIDSTKILKKYLLILLGLTISSILLISIYGYINLEKSELRLGHLKSTFFTPSTDLNELVRLLNNVSTSLHQKSNVSSNVDIKNNIKKINRIILSLGESSRDTFFKKEIIKINVKWGHEFSELSEKNYDSIKNTDSREEIIVKIQVILRSIRQLSIYIKLTSLEFLNYDAEESKNTIKSFLIFSSLLIIVYIFIFIKILKIVSLLLKTEKENKEKSMFLANMSHEIRTPMNGVIGFTDVLAELEMDEEASICIRHIKECGNHLLTIIDDILDYSKYEFAELVLEKRSFEIEAMVDNIISILSSSITKMEIKISYKICENVPKVIMSDESRVKQIIFNLMNNAMKFTKEGEIKLLIDVEHFDSDSNKYLLRFKISDEGIGIPQEKIKYLFQSFSQADESTTREYGGTGLGLAICKKLVSFFGGKISVQSVPGQGSTFTFTINVEANEQLSLEQKDLSIDLQNDEDDNILQILLVEDNEINIKLVLMILKKLGYSADVAINGMEATEAVKIKSFDLILMDLQMPIMDGIEATEIILAGTPVNNQPKIIAFSANVFNEAREKCLAAGIHGFLAKPINIQELSRTIENRKIELKIS